jgi:hypothetical protein
MYLLRSCVPSRILTRLLVNPGLSARVGVCARGGTQLRSRDHLRRRRPPRSPGPFVPRLLAGVRAVARLVPWKRGFVRSAVVRLCVRRLGGIGRSGCAGAKMGKNGRENWIRGCLLLAASKDEPSGRGIRVSDHKPLVLGTFQGRPLHDAIGACWDLTPHLASSGRQLGLRNDAQTGALLCSLLPNCIPV